MKYQTKNKLIISAYVGIMLLCIFCTVFAYYQTSTFKDDCTAKGGVTIRGKVCIDSKVIIHIK